jgi:hypothetical protein
VRGSYFVWGEIEQVFGIEEEPQAAESRLSHAAI